MRDRLRAVALLLVLVSCAAGRSATQRPPAGLESPAEHEGTRPSEDAGRSGPATPPGLSGPEERPPEEVSPHKEKQHERPTAGWDPDLGGFYLQSLQGDYRIFFGMDAAYRFQPTWRDGVPQSRMDFEVVRLEVGGNLFRKWIRFFTSAELAANPTFLLDSYVEARPIEAFGLRFGQQLTPFSRQEWRPLRELFFTNWDVVADFFSAGREKGALVFGAIGDGWIEYWFGAYGGSPIREFETFPGSFLYQARITLSPMGPVGPTEMPFALGGEVPFRISFSAQGYVGRTRIGRGRLDSVTDLIVVVPTGERQDSLAGGGDIAIQSARLSFFSEAYVRRMDARGGAPFTAVGAWAQLGYIVLGRTVGAGVRGSYLDPHTERAQDQLWVGELLAAWFVDPTHIHLQLGYAIADQRKPAAGPEQASLPLPAGTTHLITVQAGVFF